MCAGSCRWCLVCVWRRRIYICPGCTARRVDATRNRSGCVARPAPAFININRIPNSYTYKRSVCESFDRFEKSPFLRSRVIDKTILGVVARRKNHSSCFLLVLANRRAKLLVAAPSAVPSRSAEVSLSGRGRGPAAAASAYAAAEAVARPLSYVHGGGASSLRWPAPLLPLALPPPPLAVLSPRIHRRRLSSRAHHDSGNACRPKGRSQRASASPARDGLSAPHLCRM